MAGTRRKAGALGPHIEGIRALLLEAGYTPETTRNMLKVVGQVGRWLEASHVDLADFDERAAVAFIAWRHAAGYRQTQYLGQFDLFLGYLRREGVVAVARPGGKSELDVRIAAYVGWLFDERGLAEATVQRYANLARRFLQDPRRPGLLIDLAALDGRTVSAFLLAEVSRISLGSARGRVAELRALLRYLFSEGLVRDDLSGAVPSVAGWRDAGLPVAVSSREVEGMIASCDPSSPVGRRDQAILLLLARLGMRSIEVARLQLGDIDWRAGELVVRGKARRRDRLPVPVDVGQALAGYLEHGRPVTALRHVFVTVRAPRKPIPPALVHDVVRRACRRSGCAVVGPHRLRHALATQLLAKGVPLMDISQVLRHRDLATTAIYAKVDLASLRTVARPWPGATR